MKLSPWRLVHLWLALISSSILIIASVTGAILSFEPVYENSYPYRIKGADELPLSQVINTVVSQHEEVLSLHQDENGFVSLTSFEYDQPVYINPYTAEVLGEEFETLEIFEFSRALHRSLFIHKTGRFLVGIASVFLVFMCISGLWLVVQKQGGWAKLLTRVVKNDFNQDYHTKLGRLSLLVLLVVSITGTYLFLNRFDILPDIQPEHRVDEAKLVETAKMPLTDFPALKGITLKDLRSLDFPFAEDVQEFYDLKLNDRELRINQFSGEAVSQIDYPLVNLMHDLSFALHTGEGTVIWALVLGLSSLAILFFIYSGLAIYFKRGKTKLENPFSKDQCEYIVLVGSEQGSTFRFAQALHKALIKAGLKSYLTELNSYEPLNNMQKLLVLTATYGLGEATSNAKLFLNKLKDNPPLQDFDYAVLGFGSTSYPDFCQYAIAVDKGLQQLENGRVLLPLEKVNDADKSTYYEWVKSLGQALETELDIDEQDLVVGKKKAYALKVIERKQSPNPADETFLLALSANKKTLNGYTSGDLMAVIPTGSDLERLYSMSVNAQTHQITLSIRRHEHGLCSNFLSGLEPGQKLKATFKENPAFRFPNNAPGVIMVANGTGIAPFLGMMQANEKGIPVRLYWGGQNQSSYALYQESIEPLQTQGRVQSVKLAFSRQGERQYVQELIKADSALVTGLLADGHVIMICGGLSMQKGVEAVLDEACHSILGKALSHYAENEQIKADCY